MQGKTLLHFLSEHTFRELGLSKDLLSQPHKAYWENVCEFALYT